LEIDLNILKTLLDLNKVLEVKNLLAKIVKNYFSNSEIVDHIYLEQSKFDRSNLVALKDHDKLKK